MPRGFPSPPPRVKCDVSYEGLSQPHASSMPLPVLASIPRLSSPVLPASDVSHTGYTYTSEQSDTNTRIRSYM
jgi:hypothetical protein